MLDGTLRPLLPSLGSQAAAPSGPQRHGGAVSALLACRVWAQKSPAAGCTAGPTQRVRGNNTVLSRGFRMRTSTLERGLSYTPLAGTGERERTSGGAAALTAG